ncbi:hypothetical protein ACM39_03740 [Chryseobacterium sp. FH2]|uniref:helix-turn-helix domain-containing protein n=1 Tax=Chryseobacterium sp. FH2 TaxID=1674291 RepID=UPI00065ABD23|nr:helix-turn-helix transcriptional regulator [Chryseobacterium sp. FH2]KMQ69223.1 hypothetical protein ACM39_03740 [Chryseobacterium sp. FH2]
MNNSIGFKIKKLREQKDISQENLAYQLDISQSYLSKIENGVIEKLDFLFMQKIADFFKVEPQYFLDDQIIQNNADSSVGNIYSTVTIHSNVSENILKNLLNNQQQITKQQEQISQLMEMQNKLMEKLLSK